MCCDIFLIVWCLPKITFLSAVFPSFFIWWFIIVDDGNHDTSYLVIYWFLICLINKNPNFKFLTSVTDKILWWGVTEINSFFLRIFNILNAFFKNILIICTQLKAILLFCTYQKIFIYTERFSSRWLVVILRFKKSSFFHYLPVTGGKIVVLMPFQTVSALCEIQTA